MNKDTKRRATLAKRTVKAHATRLRQAHKVAQSHYAQERAK